MDLIDILGNEPLWFAWCMLPLGLVVGSFLNVVIHRLPRMLEHAWTTQAREFLHPDQPSEPGEPYNLSTPGSSCPHCGAPVRAWHNIPVFSYLVLRGRCHQCAKRISIRYPVVELLTGLLTMAVAWRFGVSWLTVGLLAFTWSLIALSAIDLDTLLLPDVIVLPMLWTGLLFNLWIESVPLKSAVLGAAFGYLLLWSVYHLFRLVTGKEGMGHGDFKLLAMLGAWLGVSSLPGIILLSSVIGAVIGIALIALTRREAAAPLPFGPFLAGAGWIMMMWGDAINTLYLNGALAG